MNLACALELPLSFLGENVMALYYWCGSTLSSGILQNFLWEGSPVTKCNVTVLQALIISAEDRRPSLFCFVFINQRNDQKHLSNPKPFVIQCQSKKTKFHLSAYSIKHIPSWLMSVVVWMRF